MQQQLNNCCTLDDTGLFPRTGQEGGSLQEGSSDLKIAPNPFTEAATLSYTLAREGQVRLEVSDAHGRLHSELLTGQHERGTYQHTWNTQDLTPGTYYVSLWLDEELLVKRAVKIAR